MAPVDIDRIGHGAAVWVWVVRLARPMVAGDDLIVSKARWPTTTDHQV